MNDPHFELEERNQVVAQIVDCLSASQYQKVAVLAPQSRVTPEQLEQAVAEYGRTLIRMPKSAHELIDYIAIAGSEPLAWHVVVPLFTEEEGRSDLSLELELSRLGNGRYCVTVDGLHVL